MKRRLILIAFIAALLSLQFAGSAFAGYGYKPGYKPFYKSGVPLFPSLSSPPGGGLNFGNIRNTMMQVPIRTTPCRNRSLLVIFGSSLTCGQGVVMPGFIDGDCPISACIIRVQSGKGSFGGPINF